MCIEGTQYQVRIDKTIVKIFTVNTGLKQGYALSLILFNIALEKANRDMQKESTGIEIS